jgi:hypothetical protein
LQPTLPRHLQANPRVFFDVAVDGTNIGRIIMEVKQDITPKTAENFIALSKAPAGQVWST